MRIVLHLGAHSTDEDRILKCLRRNYDTLAAQGIIVPPIMRYRPVIRETLKALQHNVASPDLQETLLDAILDEDDPQRVILSHEGLLCTAGRAVGEGALYPMTAKRAPRLRNLFARCEVEFHIALRDPASFVPAVFARSQQQELALFLDGTDPLDLRWSDVIKQLRKSVPDAPVTVWRNEDTPLIWLDVLKAVSGHDAATHLMSAEKFWGSLIMRRGFKRLLKSLAPIPVEDRKKRQQTAQKFLLEFARDDAVEDEIELPGWNTDYIEQLYQIYDDDMAVIRKIPGVTFISP